VILCYCESVRNITVAVPEDVYKRARVAAAEQGTSVSALVSGFLRSLADDGTEFDRLARLQERIVDEIESFSATDRLSRDEVHSRAVR